MSNTQRVQLALNVDNIDEAINYYEKLFNTKVSKVKSKYANFAIDNPPLKLVLMENKNAALRINHLGVETFQQNDVDNALARFNQHHIRHSEYENERDCCYTLYTSNCGYVLVQ